MRVKFETLYGGTMLFLACLLAWSISSQAQVIISEFLANNTKTLADQDGDYSD